MTTVLAAPRTDPRDDLFAVRDAVATVIRGKNEIVEAALLALLARGHLLIEDIPGVGKSTLAHGLARAVGGEYRRIQFTSDLLPADIVGITVLRPGVERAEFRPGPLFANFVLADEIDTGVVEEVVVPEVKATRLSRIPPVKVVTVEKETAGCSRVAAVMKRL